MNVKLSVENISYFGYKLKNTILDSYQKGNKAILFIKQIKRTNYVNNIIAKIKPRVAKKNIYKKVNMKYR